MMPRVFQRRFDTTGSMGRREMLLSGVLWAVVVTLSESLSQPAHVLEPRELAQSLLGLGSAHATAGILLSMLVVEIEARLDGWKVWCAAAGAVVGATGLHIATNTLLFWLAPGWGSDAQLTFVPEATQYAAYVLWIFAFYGGIYISALFLFLRLSRRLRQLREAERMRLMAETRVDNAKAEDSTVLIQPALVLECLSELGCRYSQDADYADRLLDLFVQFLRHAMPGLSTRTSDLATELELAARYADLRRELGWSNCTIDVEPGIDTGSVRFPAQILIRLIDEFSRAASGAATVRLQVRGDGCRVILLIDTGAHHAEHPVSRETELRLCGALYAIVGKAAEHRWINAHPAAGGDHAGLLISLPGPSSTRVSFLPEEALS